MVNKPNTDTPSGDEVTSTMVGKCLQRAREAKQLSVEDIANALHITPMYVNFIEKNQFQKLPAAIFARGYVKSYARLLNINVDEIMNLYVQQTGDKKGELSIRSAGNEYGVSMRRHAAKWATGFIFLVLLLPTIGWWYAHRNNEETIEIPVSVQATPETQSATSLPAVEDITPVVKTTPDTITDTNVDTNVDTTNADTTNSDTKTNTETVDKIEDKEKIIIETPQLLPPDNEKEATPDSGTLHIKFSGISWVQIKDVEGVTLHDAEHKAGEAINITGKPPLYVWTKNAAAVTLLFNDKLIDIKNTDDDGIARLVLGK